MLSNRPPRRGCASSARGRGSAGVALWNEGVLVRAIGMDGVSGVVEDIGEPLPFEAPFWTGRHPHEPEKFIVVARPSPFRRPFTHSIADGASSRVQRDRPRRPEPGRTAGIDARDGRLWTLTAYHMELTPDGRIVMVPKEFNPANYQ